MQIVASPREIVVVGAGIVGCAIAHELTRRGASVVVVDDREPGMGATQASAGVLAPFIEARYEGPLLELTARSLTLFDDFIARLRSVSEIGSLTYQRPGTLDVALDADQVAALTTTQRHLDPRGVDARLLDAAAVRQCEPNLSTSAIGGLLIPIHGFVAAAELTRMLAAAARRHGATFVGDGRVVRISGDGARLSLQTASAPTTLHADVAILAAGSWAGAVQIEGVMTAVPVRPVRGQLLHLHWPGPEPLRRPLWSERCYVVPWPDGTVLVGATVEDAGFEERTTLAGVQDLIDAVCELVPHAWTASLSGGNVGT